MNNFGVARRRLNRFREVVVKFPGNFKNDHNYPLIEGNGDMNKQFSAVALSMLTVFLLSACGDEKAASTEAKAVPDAKTTPARQADDGWKSFDVPGTGFIVRIPDGAPMECKDTDAGGGLKAVHCGAESESIGIMVSVTRTKEKVPADKIASVLEASVSGAAENVKGTVVDPKDVEAGGEKGKEFSIKTTDQGLLPSRSFVKDDYLVQTLAVIKDGKDDGKADAEKFAFSLQPKQ